MNTTISPVHVPYSGGIPNGVRQGLEIEIQGTVPHHAHQGFSINLCQSGDVEPTTTLHFNFRVNENVIVMNHMQNGGWGREERVSGHQFHRGKPFDIRIKVKPQMFKIRLNGNNVADFAHRLPKETAQFLVIKGEVSVSYIKFSSPGGQPGYPPSVAPSSWDSSYPQPSPAGFAPPPAPAGYGPQPVYNPPVPFVTAVPGGLYPGRMINISGVPNMGASRFTINLQSGPYDGSDIAMHMDARFNAGNDRHVVVRNHCQGGSWGSEERSLSHFPFMHNQNFDILILVEPASFKVAVNNQHMLQFNHRLPVQSANTLCVKGDLRITQVRFQ